MFIRDVSEIEDGITSIMLTSGESDLLSSIAKKTDKHEVASTMYLVNLQDRESKIYNTLRSIQEIQKDCEYDCLIFIKKEGNSISYLTHRSKPEAEYDWMDVALAFKEHYAMKEVDDTGYWRWGQVVAEDGEYLCLDCGYIEDLKAGQIFPVCEVCLAGDPEGPLSVRDGYWEKI
jgi:predicted Zn-ribbon and HTH transcriptional regulator